MRLVLFDLDNTLIAGDSDYEWGQFLIDHGVLEREVYEAQNRAHLCRGRAQRIAREAVPLARHALHVVCRQSENPPDEPLDHARAAILPA